MQNRFKVMVGVAFTLSVLGLGGCASMKHEVSGVTRSAESIVGMKSGSSTGENNSQKLGGLAEQMQGKILKVTPIMYQGKTGELASNVGNETNSYGSQYADRAIESKAGYGWLGSVASSVANHVISNATKSAEKNAGKQPGLRLVVKVNSDNVTRIVTIKQPGKRGTFTKGENVLVDLYSTGAVRVETL